MREERNAPPTGDGEPDRRWEDSAAAETEPLPMLSGSASHFSLPCLSIAYHDDPTRIGERVQLTRIVSGQPIAISRLEPLFGRASRDRRPLLDPHLSRKPLTLRALPDERIRIDASATTTRIRLNREPIEGIVDLPMSTLERGIVFELAESVVLLLHLRDPTPTSDLPTFGLVGQSDAMTRVRRDIARIAPLDLPVLVHGETGTGKELVASAIHHHGRRAGAPFVAINMAALPPSLATAELFGSVRGAFTGATERRGHFARAHGGTLFLDEIGETPDEVQPLLLRALETGEIRALGEGKDRKVDVRPIAATDRQLERAIDEGHFRAPLLHRLAGFEIRTPPLRDRLEDLVPLLLHFLSTESDAESTAADEIPNRIPWLRASLVARMLGYSWPGNVRQLRNVALQLSIVGHNGSSREAARRLEALLAREGTGSREAEASRQPASAPSTDSPSMGDKSTAGGSRAYRRAEEVSEEELIGALRAHGWKFQPTAKALGISRTTLYRLIERSDRVRKPTELTREELERGLEEHGDDRAAMAEALEVSLRGLEQRLRQLHML